MLFSLSILSLLSDLFISLRKHHECAVKIKKNIDLNTKDFIYNQFFAKDEDSSVSTSCISSNQTVIALVSMFFFSNNFFDREPRDLGKKLPAGKF